MLFNPLNFRSDLWTYKLISWLVSDLIWIWKLWFNLQNGMGRTPAVHWSLLSQWPVSFNFLVNLVSFPPRFSLGGIRYSSSTRASCFPHAFALNKWCNAVAIRCSVIFDPRRHISTCVCVITTSGKILLLHCQRSSWTLTSNAMMLASISHRNHTAHDANYTYAMHLMVLAE